MMNNAKKSGSSLRTEWFRFYVYSFAQTVRGCAPEDVAKAMLAIVNYATEGAQPDKETLGWEGYALFRLVQGWVDRAADDYAASVENGKRGAAARAAKRNVLNNATLGQDFDQDDEISFKPRHK